MQSLRAKPSVLEWRNSLLHEKQSNCNNDGRIWQLFVFNYEGLWSFGLVVFTSILKLDPEIHLMEKDIFWLWIATCKWIQPSNFDWYKRNEGYLVLMCCESHVVGETNTVQLKLKKIIHNHVRNSRKGAKKIKLWVGHHQLY